MDAATAERINNLAKNLKELHLATSIEDAFQKAREIILGNAGTGKPIKELMDDERAIQQSEQVQIAANQDIHDAGKLSRQLDDVKELQTKDELNNAELAQQVTKVSEQLKREQEQLAKIRNEIEAAKQALAAAKQTEQRFERQTPSMDITHPVPQQNLPPPQKPRSTLTDEDKKKADLSRIFNFGKR
jgi:hypothetical protein